MTKNESDQKIADREWKDSTDLPEDERLCFLQGERFANETDGERLRAKIDLYRAMKKNDEIQDDSY